MSDWIEISIPYLNGKEYKYLKECITTNFVSSIGPFISKFEDLVSESIGLNSKNSAATSSGTTALQLGLIALGVKKNDLVVIPSFSFIATANAVTHVGASPWLLDIEMNNLTLDPDKLFNQIKKNTYEDNNFRYHKKTKQKIACIVPVHVLGFPPDLDQIKDISKKFNIPILLDAACGIGSKYKNKRLGEIELPGIISFNGNKTITTGAGGIFYSNNDHFIQKVKHLSSTAKCSSSYDHDEVGFNFRMSNIQAALGLAQIEQLQNIIYEKKVIHNNYFDQLISKNKFKLITNSRWGESSHWLNAILLENSDDMNCLISRLREAKIRANYFWKPIHLQKPYLNCLQANLEYLNDLQKRLLILPSSPSLSSLQQDRVINTINSFFQ